MFGYSNKSVTFIYSFFRRKYCTPAEANANFPQDLNQLITG